MTNTLHWFEVPVTDIEQVAKVYSTILATRLAIGEMSPGRLMTMLPTDAGGVGGGLVQGEGYVPSTVGSLAWLNSSKDMSVVSNRVEDAGGKVLVPKMSIGKHGFAASFLDIEGSKSASTCRARDGSIIWALPKHGIR
ncbi:MAG TPA: VOC family protein [Anaerolineae bacterium]|nr:VOC family protein [Anaerolineae bacterium]